MKYLYSFVGLLTKKMVDVFENVSVNGKVDVKVGVEYEEEGEDYLVYLFLNL